MGKRWRQAEQNESVKVESKRDGDRLSGTTAEKKYGREMCKDWGE